MYSTTHPLRLAILGCGGRGRSLGKEIESIGLGKITALCDPSTDPLQAAQQLFPSAPTVQTPTELKRRGGVDAIIIASPDDTHVDLALSLQGSGKHLLIEKPLATSISDCDRLLMGYQAEPQTIIMVGLCMRYNNLAHRVHELASSGTIGEILTAHCIDHVEPGGRYYFHRWMSRKKHVVGLLLQKGCHSLDFISWIINSPAVKVHAFGGLDYFGGEEPPDKVCSTCNEFDDCTEHIGQNIQYDYMTKAVRTTDFCAYSREIDVCDNSVVNVLYANGAKLSYSEVHFTPDYVREFIFIGTQGRIRASLPHSGPPTIELTFRHRPKKVITETIELGQGGHSGGDRAMLEELIAAINEKRQPLTDLHAGRECAAISIAAEESIETGEVVKIRNVDGSPRTLTRQKGRSRNLSRRKILGAGLKALG